MLEINKNEMKFQFFISFFLLHSKERVWPQCGGCVYGGHGSSDRGPDCLRGDDPVTPLRPAILGHSSFRLCSRPDGNCSCLPYQIQYSVPGWKVSDTMERERDMNVSFVCTKCYVLLHGAWKLRLKGIHLHNFSNMSLFDFLSLMAWQGLFLDSLQI